MKKNLLSYLFFTIYLFALLKPMLPVLDYIANYDYIANELCKNKSKPILDCNGKCYVAKEIKELNLLDDILIPKVEFEKYITTNSKLEVKLENLDFLIKKTNLYYLKINNDVFLSLPLQPPIV